MAVLGAAGAGELAEGIYQALVTTVGGLLVAIPSLAAFAVLRNRVDQLVAEAAGVIHRVCRPLRRRTMSQSVGASLHFAGASYTSFDDWSSVHTAARSAREVVDRLMR